MRLESTAGSCSDGCVQRWTGAMMDRRRSDRRFSWESTKVLNMESQIYLVCWFSYHLEGSYSCTEILVKYVMSCSEILVKYAMSCYVKGSHMLGRCMVIEVDSYSMIEAQYEICMLRSHLFLKKNSH